MAREYWEVGHNRETYSLFMGLITLVFCLFFFGVKFGIIKDNLSITDEIFLNFFVVLSVASMIVHFLSTIDF